MAILRNGSRGQLVTALQHTLARLGYPVAVDGVYGPATAEAVATFQASQGGLEVDGVVGPATRTALAAARPTQTAAPAGTGDAVMASFVQRHPDLATTPRARVVRRALDFLGAREQFGTNRGPEIDPMVEGYREHVGLGPSHQGPPWCAIFLSSAIKQGLGLAANDWRATPMGEWLASANAYEDWAKAAGCWSDEPAPGAVGVIKYAERPTGGYSGHVGMVLWVDGNVVTSVDGNVTDSVALRKRQRAEYRGFVHWWRGL